MTLKIHFVTIYILKLHDTGYLDKNIYIYISTKGHLPPEGAGKCQQEILGFWIYTPMTINILKLHDTDYLDKHISHSKGISILKVQEKAINYSWDFGHRPK